MRMIILPGQTARLTYGMVLLTVALHAACGRSSPSVSSGNASGEARPQAPAVHTVAAAVSGGASPAAADAPAPGSCATRPASPCGCQGVAACEQLLAQQLEGTLKRCMAQVWDCGFVSLSLDQAGCARVNPETHQPRFVRCVEGELDRRRWPCAASTTLRLSLGSCTVN
jgi:hypothetical protein